MSLSSQVNDLATRIGAEIKAVKALIAGKANTSHTHVATTDLTATGTKDATTYLRGDNTWSAPPSGGTPADATTTTKGVVQLATSSEATTGTDAVKAITPSTLKTVADTKAPSSHTHTAANISDSTTTGRSVLTATDAAAARTAIGAGTSSLAIGTTAGTAKEGNYQPTAANISDSTATGRSVLTATDAAAARTAIGAGTGSGDVTLANNQTFSGVKTFPVDTLIMSNGAVTAEPYSDANPPSTLNLTEVGVTAITTPVSGQATLFTRDGTGLRIRNDAGQEFPVADNVATALTDGATIATDASAAARFRVTVAGDRTFSAPTNAMDGMRIMYEITASGANRTVTFATGATGAFAYGTDFTSIPVITSGTTTFVGVTYSSRSSRWHILAVSSGHA